MPTVSVIIAATIVFSASSSYADEAVCRQQADAFVQHVPNLTQQTGIQNGAGLIADVKGRWGLAASSFAYATGQMAGANAGSYWVELMLLSDGLLRCFDADKANETYKDVAPNFEQRFSEDDRAKLIAGAMAALTQGSN